MSVTQTPAPELAAVATPNDETVRGLAGERRIGFRVLLAGLVVFGVGQSMLFAVLPPLARQIGISEARVASIFSISAFVWVLCSLPWGRVSDARGRRPVLLVGLGGHALSTLGFAVAADLGRSGVLSALGCYWALVLTRTLYGMLGAGIVPAAQAYVVDRTRADERVASLGAIGAAFGIGTMVGPAFAGALSYFGLTLPLYAAAVLAALAATALWRLLPEHTPPRDRSRHLQLRSADRRLWLYIGLTLGLSIAQAVTTQVVGFYVIDAFHVPVARGAQYAGIAMTAAGLCALLVQLALMRRLRVTPLLLVRTGLGFGIVGNLWIVLAPGFFAYVVGMACLGLFSATTVTGLRAAATRVAGTEQQGAAAGLLNAALGLGYVLTPLVVLLLYEGIAPIAPYAMNFLLVAAMYVTLHIAVRRMPGLA